MANDKLLGNDKKVYIIYNERYPMYMIKEELRREEYKYNFHFHRNLEALIEAEEVWCFSDCTNEEDYKKAVELGKSIWQMG